MYYKKKKITSLYYVKNVLVFIIRLTLNACTYIMYKNVNIESSAFCYLAFSVNIVIKVKLFLFTCRPTTAIGHLCCGLGCT